MKNKVIIELQDIRKEFPGVIALDQVNMKIREGSVHALIGENGAGKSTLMKILSGTYLNYSGKILIDGKEIHMKSEKDAFSYGISIVAQELNYVSELTIAQNMYIGREPKVGKFFINHKKQLQNCKEMLKSMGLDYSPNDKMGDLSVAQRQMIEIVKALSRNAKLIIMDEPTSALTNKEAEILFLKIKELKEKGISFIFISHRLEEIFTVCDEYTVLRDGKWIQSGDIKTMDQNKLIALMVGRNITDIYPKLPEAGKEIMLSVDSISSEGVFTNISFDIHKGEIMGFAGMMGAGRSEIARTIFGMEPINSGSITLDGEKVKFKTIKDAITHGVAMVTEDRAVYGFVGVRSISDNIALPNMDRYTNKGILKHKTIRENSENIFTQLSIKAPGIQTNVNTLSGGNQQKVVLAKWLVRDVKLLILDEPTRGIDVGAKQEIYNLIVELAKKGMSILLISSDMPEVLSMSHRIAVVADGRISGILSKEEATQNGIMRMIVEARNERE